MKLAASIIATSFISSILCSSVRTFKNFGDEFSLSSSRKSTDDYYNSFYDICKINTDFAKSNVLKREMSKINDILDARYDKLTSKGRIHETRILDCFEDNGSTCLYRHFKACAYLVNPRFFTAYENALAAGRFVDCYYLLLKTRRPNECVRKYVDVINCKIAVDASVLSNAIFVCDKELFLTVSLKCYKNRNICTSDIVLDIKKIYSMNLQDRLDLLENLYIHHLKNSDINSNDWSDFLKRYEFIFRKGRESDIKCTSFVLYYLYSDVITGKMTKENFNKLNKMLQSYEKKNKQTIIILNFFYMFTFGSC
ncbi:Spore wall protein 30 [Nosema granulosis]|uniref:Spore wall protein 30 n=1 Tax=Nosema granulosis TaxID=83296 RepID=A0A9P6H001_9MICR|nr:Spore wall protein 30 [Nosema granulosis]